MNDSFSLALTRRIKTAGLLCFIVAMILQWRLFDLQVVHHQALAASGKISAQRNIVWKPDRGVILDRNQRLLVWNKEKESVVALPAKIEDPALAARALAPLLAVSEETLLRRMKMDRDEVSLRRRVDPQVTRSIRALGIQGIDFRPEPHRQYLKGPLAGQVVGYVDIDNKGQGGIERSEEMLLAPKEIEVRARAYGDKKAILDLDYMREVPLRGADVVLALDETIQWISETALNKMCIEQEAKGGVAIVMDVQTGAVLAMANYPEFAPERVGDYATKGEFSRAKNQCITNLYEPGSTIKPFVVAAGLDCGAVDTDTIIDCEGGKRWIAPKYRRTPIKDEHRMGRVDVGEVLVHSSNIGVGKIAEKIVNLDPEEPNRKRLFDYLEAFKLTGKTGIDLPAETPMILRPWDRWNLNDLLVVSFGTGPIMVSPIGLATAYSILANGGREVSPHIVQGYLNSRDRILFPARKSPGRQVVNEVDARTVCDTLVEVVERGTGKKALSDWYHVGGKTGTAKKVVNGSYSDSLRVLSFAGFAPADPPLISVVVMIDEPKKARFGGQVGAPVFREIVEQTLAYMHVPPDLSPSESKNRKQFRHSIEEVEEIEADNYEESVPLEIAETSHELVADALQPIEPPDSRADGRELP